METTFIYALCEPETLNIRYIGKADDVNRRFRLHLREIKRYPNTHKSRWIESVLKERRIPSLEILDEVPKNFWQLYEQKHIQMAKNAGFDLVNGTEGGDGGATRSGKNFSEETRRRMSLSIKRAYKNKDTTGKNNAFFGRKHSPEAREKMSLAKKNKISGMNNPFFGKKHSKKSKDKMSASHSGQNHHNFGKKLSPETIEKLSKARKEYYARKKVLNGVS